MGGNFKPVEPKTHFHFPNQEGSFVRAILRCVGVGKCRNEEGGLMCPSYMATRDEKHSTRGRAHLLFGMLKGETIQRRSVLRSEEVKDALDLCPACKGRKTDCPTNVDMATYKAEFLSHYEWGRSAPQAGTPSAGLSGGRGSVLAAPAFANFTKRACQPDAQAPGRHFLCGGTQIPPLAKETFQSWFHGSRRKNSLAVSADKLRRHDLSSNVLLWPDTFNNFFHPETAYTDRSA